VTEIGVRQALTDRNVQRAPAVSEIPLISTVVVNRPALPCQPAPLPGQGLELFANGGVFRSLGNARALVRMSEVLINFGRHLARRGSTTQVSANGRFPETVRWQKLRPTVKAFSAAIVKHLKCLGW
jgi:hypothetical protein